MPLFYCFLFITQQLLIYICTTHLSHTFLLSNDPKKGEKVILLATQIENGGVVRKQLMEGKEDSLSIPATVCPVESILKIGTGKTDLHRTKQLEIALIEA